MTASSTSRERRPTRRRSRRRRVGFPRDRKSCWTLAASAISQKYRSTEPRSARSGNRRRNHVNGDVATAQSKRRGNMKVLEYLNDRHVNFNVLPHDDTFDSQHLAEAVHVSGRQVAKTVLLRMDHGYRYAVAILPASFVIDLAAIGEILGGA